MTNKKKPFTLELAVVIALALFNALVIYPKWGTHASWTFNAGLCLGISLETITDLIAVLRLKIWKTYK